MTVPIDRGTAASAGATIAAWWRAAMSGFARLEAATASGRALLRGVQRPAGALLRRVEQPARALLRRVERPAGALLRRVERPARALLRRAQRRAGALLRRVQRPAGALLRRVEQPVRAMLRRVPRPAGALLASLLFPGLGLLVTGARRAGLAVAGAAAAVIVGLLLWYRIGLRSAVAAAAVSPTWLWFLIIASVSAMAVRVVASLAALRAAAQRSPAPPLTTGLALIVVMTAICVPHVLVVRYASEQLDLLDTVFADVPATVAMPGPEPGLDLADQMAASPAMSTWHGSDRLTMLVLGSDAGFDRVGVRTDTIIVVSIDVETGDAAVFSIPRNWEGIPFPNGSPAADAYPDGYPGLANAIYGLGVERRDLFPGAGDPGATAIKQAMAQLLGIPIQYYVRVGMPAVVETIDLFGGLDLVVTERIDDGIGPIEAGGPPLTIETRPGKHHFDGLTTLAYVRSRIESSDYNRMARQRCVIGAMIDQVDSFEVLANHDELAKILAEHVTTDVPIDELPSLLDIAQRMDPATITSINFVPPDYPAGRAPTALVRQEVRRVLDPERAASPAGRSEQPGPPPSGGPEQLDTACRLS